MLIPRLAAYSLRLEDPSKTSHVRACIALYGQANARGDVYQKQAPPTFSHLLRATLVCSIAANSPRMCLTVSWPLNYVVCARQSYLILNLLVVSGQTLYGLPQSIDRIFVRVAVRDILGLAHIFECKCLTCALL
jgi:hypothetical protein